MPPPEARASCATAERPSPRPEISGRGGARRAALERPDAEHVVVREGGDLVRVPHAAPHLAPDRRDVEPRAVVGDRDPEGGLAGVDGDGEVPLRRLPGGDAVRLGLDAVVERVPDEVPDHAARGLERAPVGADVASRDREGDALAEVSGEPVHLLLEPGQRRVGGEEPERRDDPLEPRRPVRERLRRLRELATCALQRLVKLGRAARERGREPQRGVDVRRGDADTLPRVGGTRDERRRRGRAVGRAGRVRGRVLGRGCRRVCRRRPAASRRDHLVQPLEQVLREPVAPGGRHVRDPLRDEVERRLTRRRRSSAPAGRRAARPARGTSSRSCSAWASPSKPRAAAAPLRPWAMRPNSRRMSPRAPAVSRSARSRSEATVSSASATNRPTRRARVAASRFTAHRLRGPRGEPRRVDEVGAAGEPAREAGDLVGGASARQRPRAGPRRARADPRPRRRPGRRPSRRGARAPKRRRGPRPPRDGAGEVRHRDGPLLDAGDRPRGPVRHRDRDRRRGTTARATRALSTAQAPPRSRNVTSRTTRAASASSDATAEASRGRAARAPPRRRATIRGRGAGPSLRLRPAEEQLRPPRAGPPRGRPRGDRRVGRERRRGREQVPQDVAPARRVHVDEVAAERACASRGGAGRGTARRVPRGARPPPARRARARWRPGCAARSRRAAPPGRTGKAGPAPPRGPTPGPPRRRPSGERRPHAAPRRAAPRHGAPASGVEGGAARIPPGPRRGERAARGRPARGGGPPAARRRASRRGRARVRARRRPLRLRRAEVDEDVPAQDEVVRRAAPRSRGRATSTRLPTSNRHMARTAASTASAPRRGRTSPTLPPQPVGPRSAAPTTRWPARWPPAPPAPARSRARRRGRTAAAAEPGSRRLEQPLEQDGER